MNLSYDVRLEVMLELFDWLTLIHLHDPSSAKAQEYLCEILGTKVDQLTPKIKKIKIKKKNSNNFLWCYHQHEFKPVGPTHMDI